MDVCTRNLWQRAEVGNKPCTKFTTRVPQTFCSKGKAQSVPETCGHAYYVLPQSTQEGLRKRERKERKI